MAAFYSANGAGELLPRYSFLEPLLHGRRVLELGAAGATEGASAVFLAERGAAAVLSVDSPEAVERAAQAAHHPFVQFRSIDLATLPRGAFDLVAVADGAALATDPARVAELKGLLAEDGLLVAAVRAPGGASLLALQGERPPGADEVPAYESFAGALAAEFEVVEMATQSAMVGYVLAPGQAGPDPEIAVDGSLAGPAEAAYYLAICGSAPSGLEGLTLVALPPRPLADVAVEHGEAARAHQGCLAAAEAGADTESLRRAVAEREEALVAKDVEIAEALARVAERERLAAEKDARFAELEVEADAARVRADGLSRELEQEREARFEVQASLDRAQAATRDAEARRDESGRAAEEMARLRAELEAERASKVEVEASGQAARAEAQAARTGVESALARAEGAEGRASALEVRSAELEMRAAEQEARVAELEAELARTRERLAAREAEAEEARRAAAAADEERSRLSETAAAGEALRGELAAAKASLEAAEAKARSAEAQATPMAEELERLRREAEGQPLARSRLEADVAAARNAAEAAEAQAAALEAELQAVRWERDELEQRAQSGGQGAGSAGEVARLREELEARSAEVAAARAASEQSAAEAAAAVARLEQAEARASQGTAGPDPELEARVRELEGRLAEALRHEADADAMAQAARAAAGGEAAEVAAALKKAAQERDTYAAQIADREGRIARLQRELADKTERLGRLAQEVGELKSKGLGKLFTR